jgi:hypothetical protein
MNFLKAKTLKNRKEKMDIEKVNKFISKFNTKIQSRDYDEESYLMNNIIDKIPTLNITEFDYSRGLAMQQGWILSQFDDNYQTITYKMKKR